MNKEDKTVAIDLYNPFHPKLPLDLSCNYRIIAALTQTDRQETVVLIERDARCHRFVTYRAHAMPARSRLACVSGHYFDTLQAGMADFAERSGLNA